VESIIKKMKKNPEYDKRVEKTKRYRQDEPVFPNRRKIISPTKKLSDDDFARIWNLWPNFEIMKDITGLRVDSIRNRLRKMRKQNEYELKMPEHGL